MARLIMFDIDGTLTATSAVDTSCYAQAMGEYLGREINTDWAQYRHVTDSGIAVELFERHGRPLGEIGRPRRRFIDLIAQCLAVTPDCCVEIPGASAFLNHLRQIPQVALGLATGGWSETAHAKLAHAGIDVTGITFASADDAQARIEIMKTCSHRVTHGGVPLSETIYIGDGVWDAKAARSLGWRFIGIGRGARADRLREEGVRHLFPDYSDPEAVLAALDSRAV